MEKDYNYDEGECIYDEDDYNEFENETDWGCYDEFDTWATMTSPSTLPLRAIPRLCRISRKNS